MPGPRRRDAHLALLAAFAAAASVLAVGVSPAAAQAGRAEAAAKYSACVGPATADAGFTDMAAGRAYNSAVNCLAYYGITKGKTTAATFSPEQPISRWQLAVMLQRAAGPAGVTLPAAQDQGFADISDLDGSFQDAVNQTTGLGIMAGASATTFDPDGTVPRAAIAEALAGFLANALPGPGGRLLSRNTDGSFTIKEGPADHAETIDIDEIFLDISGVPYSTNLAIRALAEMGVITGQEDGNFDPAASVTRAEAAVFVARALAHTNARPAGLTIQAEKTAVPTNEDFELSISLRGDDFAPIDNASVDVFSYIETNARTAFKTNRTCNVGSSGVVAVGGGASACVIELSDEVTDLDGNLLISPGRIARKTVFWAWSGDIDDTLDWDASPNLSMDNSIVSSAASIAMTTVTTPAEAKVTTSVSADAKDGNTVRYGTTVTVTIQLVDGLGRNIGISGHTYMWSATGTHDPTGPDRVLSGIGTNTLTTNSSGRATFTLTQADPDTDATRDIGSEDDEARDTTTWTYSIVSESNVPISNNSDIGFTGGSGKVIFTDADALSHKVNLSLRRPWTMQPEDGDRAHINMTGKVSDQYGNAVKRHPIFFDIDGDATFGCATPPSACGTGDDTIDETSGLIGGTTRYTTRFNGTSTINAAYTSGKPETAVYRVAADLNGNGDVGDPGEQATVTHYWVLPPFGWNEATGTASCMHDYASITIVDLVGNSLVISSTQPDSPGDTHQRVYKYASSTLFDWSVQGNPSVVRRLNMKDFEARMATHLADNDGVPQAALKVLQYNTKSGISIMEVRLNTGQDIHDPVADG